MSITQEVVKRFVSENAEALKIGMSWADFKSVLNDIAVKEGCKPLSSQQDAKKAVERFFKIKSSKATVNGKNVNVWIVDPESSSFDSSTSSDLSSSADELTDEGILMEKMNYSRDLKCEDDMYIALCLFIIQQKSWESKMNGVDPDDYAKETREWLIKNSAFADRLYNGMDLKSQGISKNDLIKRFYSKNKYLQVFCESDLDIDELKRTFDEVIKAIAINHPKWKENYEARKARDRQEAMEDYERRKELDKINAEIEAERRRQEEAELAREAAEVARQKDALNEKRKSLLQRLVPYGYVSSDETDIKKMKDVLARNRIEISYLDRIKDKPIEKLNIGELKSMLDLALRVHNVEIKERSDYSFRRRDAETDYLINRIVYQNLKVANSKFVDADDILKEYEKYMSPNPENFYDELTTYDDFAIYKLLASKMIEMWEKLSEIDKNDIDLRKVAKYARRNINDSDLYGLITCEGGDCCWLKQFYDKEKEILSILSVYSRIGDYKLHVSRLIKLMGEKNKRYVEATLKNQHYSRETRIELRKKEDRRKAAELQWAKGKDGWLCLFKESGNSVWRNMHFDKDRKCFFYYPDEYNTSIMKDVTIADVKDESRWKIPVLNKDDEAAKLKENAEMQMFRNFMAFGSLMNYMSMKGVPQSEAFSTLAEGKLQPSNVEFPSDKEEESDDEDERDEELKRKDEELSDKEDELSEMKMMMKMMMKKMERLEEENRKLKDKNRRMKDNSKI